MTSANLSTSVTSNLNPKPPDLPNLTVNYAEKVSFAPALRQHFQANWDIKGRATISEIWDGRHLLVILDSEADMVAALTCPLRKIQHALFRLFRYSTDYNPKLESTTTTKWIRLPGLPPPFFHKSYIGAIVNSFAYFLDTDERTKACATMRYARACIECDVTIPIPGKVWVGLPDNKGFWQDVILEGNMSYCSHCKVHGHELARCRKKNPSNSAAPTKDIKQKKQSDPIDVETERNQRRKQHGPDTGHSSSSSANQKVETEWRIVDTKKSAKRIASTSGYGPDMLYEHTNPSKPASNQVLPSEDMGTRDNDPGILEVELTNKDGNNRVDTNSSNTTQLRDGNYLSDKHILQAGFAMLEKMDNGQSADEYSTAEKKTIRDRMAQMIARMASLKAHHNNADTSANEDNLINAPATLSNDS